MDLSTSRVVDLFSGAGGMSYGFHAHSSFEIVGAVDDEVGKPSTGHGAIDCNTTYTENIKIEPLALDLSAVSAEKVADLLLPPGNQEVDVLLACPPCTGFSAVVPKNWAHDDPRNSLVAHVADHVARLKPHILIMENVPQLFRGNFSHHYKALEASLEKMGYRVQANAYNLARFGLPQQRRRAIVIAVSPELPLLTLGDLWEGYEVDARAITVRNAIGHLPPIGSGETHPSDPNHTSTLLKGESLSRIAAMPLDGGSWRDLLGKPETEKYLIPSMWKAVKSGQLNYHSDVYGRMYWDRPAPTIKRECSHVGNGRYAHPEQPRQCTVRELAILQGFPEDYRFKSTSRKNLYRQVGDAVPPLVSYQLACLARWIMSGRKPSLEEILLPATSLTSSNIISEENSGDAGPGS
jgi:DNA (cytosine-5)-methyltransferase 1